MYPIGLIVSPNPKAEQISAQLQNMYQATVVSVRFQENVPLLKDLNKYRFINHFIAIGGDGACLRAMRVAYEMACIRKTQHIPRVFGLNCGHVGALSNKIGDINRLPYRLDCADYRLVKPLSVKTTFRNKIMYHTFFNEVILKPYANITQLKIVWKESNWYQKNIRGGLMIATKIGENAMNACNYVGAEEILPIPDTDCWRMSTLNAMSNDIKCDKPFQKIIPSNTSVNVDVINPYDDRNAQITGDSYYNDGEEELRDSHGEKIGTKVKILFVDKIRIATAKRGIFLGHERE